MLLIITYLIYLAVKYNLILCFDISHYVSYDSYGKSFLKSHKCINKFYLRKISNLLLTESENNCII